MANWSERRDQAELDRELEAHEAAVDVAELWHEDTFAFTSRLRRWARKGALSDRIEVLA